MQLCYILLVLALLSDYVNAVGGRKKENRESFGLHDVDFDAEVVCGKQYADLRQNPHREDHHPRG